MFNQINKYITTNILSISDLYDSRVPRVEAKSMAL